MPDISHLSSRQLPGIAAVVAAHPQSANEANPVEHQENGAGKAGIDPANRSDKHIPTAANSDKSEDLPGRSVNRRASTSVLGANGRTPEKSASWIPQLLTIDREPTLSL